MFNVLKYYKLFFGVSILTLVIGVSALGVYRLKPGIDFTGGTLTELKFKNVPDVDKIQQVLNSADIGSVLVQTTGETGVIIKTGVLENEKHKEVVEKLNAEVGGFEQTQFESIGPVVGKELRKDALWQLLLVSGGIIFYIAYAFRKVQKPITSWRFGWAAIIALLHDLLVVLGIFAILGHFKGVEIDSMFVTAMLTVLGFSVHDTIVVFDRIRENLKVFAGQSIEYVVNKSITQTMVRSLNTSLTVLFMLLALLLFGGASIHYFVLALFVGIITGTYSSIFIASPILVIWQNWAVKKQKSR